MALVIGVIGRGVCEGNEEETTAEAVGREVARRGHVLITGGLGGVMEAASRGAAEEKGLVLGLLPGPDKQAANQWVTVALPTALGHARNILIAQAADALIALPGGFGTLSEVAFGLRVGTPVISLGSWEPAPEVIRATSPADAVDRAENAVETSA